LEAHRGPIALRRHGAVDRLLEELRRGAVQLAHLVPVPLRREDPARRGHVVALAVDHDGDLGGRAAQLLDRCLELGPLGRAGGVALGRFVAGDGDVADRAHCGSLPCWRSRLRAPKGRRPRPRRQGCPPGACALSSALTAPPSENSTMRRLVPLALIATLTACPSYDSEPYVSSDKGLLDADQWAGYGPDHAIAIAVGREFGAQDAATAAEYAKKFASVD